MYDETVNKTAGIPDWMSWKIKETAAPYEVHMGQGERSTLLRFLNQSGWMVGGKCRPLAEITLVLMGIGLLGRDIIAGHCAEAPEDGGYFQDQLMRRCYYSLFNFSDLQDTILPAMGRLRADVVAAKTQGNFARSLPSSEFTFTLPTAGRTTRQGSDKPGTRSFTAIVERNLSNSITSCST